MNDRLQFETPENVQVQYSPAGLGTRFIAWFADQILVMLLIIAILIVLAILGTSFGVVEELLDPEDSSPEQIGMYFIFIAMIVWGLGNLVYFTGCELFWRGQTPGKRMTGIRVIRSEGFGLDAGSILVRNVFRLIDDIPLMWVIPVMSRRSQRSGDMVAGTVVVFDQLPQLSSLRVQLAGRDVRDAEFRFDLAMLQRLQEQDFVVIEKLLDRLGEMPGRQADEICRTLVISLTSKMKTEPPSETRRVRFLEDLLAAEIRRQERVLG